jgi:raffinose/stachyose/melibiose transport system permease protein
MLVPGLALYAVFMFYPFLLSIRYSLLRWDGFGDPVFVGLENFSRLFTQETFSVRLWGALQHTLFWYLGLLVLWLGAGLLLALLISYFRPRGAGLFKSIYFLPMVIAPVAVGYLWNLMLNPRWGFLNQALSALGLESWTRAWLGDPATALPAIIAVACWRTVGFSVLLFSAAIDALPEEYMEAARIDGASRPQVIRHIVLPLLRPTTNTIVIITFIWAFNSFDMVYAMAGPTAGPFFSTDVLATFFYRTAFGSQSLGDIGMGSAIAVVILVLVLTGTLLLSRLFRRD